MFSVDKIRLDFPILERLIHGHPMSYLDSTATTQKPVQVLNALDDYYRRYNANVHRGLYLLSEEATEAYEEARKKVARFIGARHSSEVIFTRGTTESLNLVASTWGTANLKPGDEIVTTELEHHSNLVPWQMLAQRTGAVLRFIRLAEPGVLDISNIGGIITNRTKIVAFAHVSNALGTINPVKEIIAAAHAVGAIVVLDGAQSVPHMPVNVVDLDCDFMAFSGHKMLGPTGIGGLYGKAALLDAMPPYQGGGEMIDDVQLERSTYKPAPAKFEAGTPDIAGAIGFGAATDYLTTLGMENVRAHEKSIVTYALEAMSNLDDIDVYGPRDDRGGVVSFNIRSVHAHDTAQVLDEFGVAVRAGHHCAQPLMRWLKVPSTVRASFYVYTTTDDIDRLVGALHKVKELFAGVAHT